MSNDEAALRPPGASRASVDAVPTLNRRAMLGAFGGPEEVRVETGPVPAPGAGEVRVRIEASSVTATDTVIRKGLYPVLRVKPPVTLGYDLVGRVDAVGDDVRGFALGDRVAAIPQVGGNADYLCLPAAALTRIPARTDAAEAACLVLSWITAQQMLSRLAHVQSGQRVLVQGASGAVGTALVQLAKVAGAEVVGTASAGKLALLDALGARAVDYASPRLEEQLRALAPDGYDAVFDPVGVASFRRSFRLSRPRTGKLVTFATQAVARGLSRTSPWAFAKFGLHFAAMQVLLAAWRSAGRDARFYGVVDHHREHRDWYEEDLARLFALHGEGRIRPVVQRLSLDEAGQAHALLESGSVRGQLVLLTGA